MCIVYRFTVAGFKWIGPQVEYFGQSKRNKWLLPNFKTFRWLRVTPGSIVAIILWILLSTGFRTYLAYYNSYNKAYGSLGAVIIMMLWLYLSAAALTVGGVINSVFEEMKITTVEPDDGKKDS